MIRILFILTLLTSALPSVQAQSVMQGSGAAQSEAERALARQGISVDELARYPDVQLLLQKNDAVGASRALETYFPAHENDPEYFNLAGLIALRANDYAAAAIAFERVVLMQPDNAGAWLDLAVSSLEAGHIASASAYFDHVEASFAPPPGLRAVIAEYRERMKGVAPPVSGWHFSVEALGGHDTNANSGLKNSSIPLTVGGDIVDLPLDPSYQAHGDNFVQANASASYRQLVGNNLLEAALSVRQRTYAAEHNFSTTDLTASAGGTRSTGLGDISLWGHVSDLSLGGVRLMRSMRFYAQLEQSVKLCRLGLSAESDLRRYVTLTNLNANLLWLQTGLACEVRAGAMPIQTAVFIRGGVDVPTGVRAGGQTRHAEIVAQVSAPLAWGISADLSISVANAQDREGYSALLELNAARRLTRQYTRLSLSYPLMPGMQLVGALDDSRIRSNLPLFEQSGRTVSLGIKKQF
jgi:tetratricopeptide (TPR) repeat protein